jgi:hypothetical protein
MIKPTGKSGSKSIINQVRFYGLDTVMNTIWTEIYEKNILKNVK